MKKSQSHNAGFTLIELMVVVAIIGILAAVAISQYSAYRMKTFNAAALADIRNFKAFFDSYLFDANGYPHL